MTTKTVKLLVFLTLLIHGIGHLQGVVSGLGVKFKENSSTRSWLLKGSSDNLNRITCLILYLGASLFGIMAALGFMNVLIPHPSWQTFALISACISTVCLMMFPAALAMFFNKIGAIAVNLIIFYSILFNSEFPSAAFND